MSYPLTNLNGVAASAHAFRVTLRLLFSSTNCPDDLEAIIEALMENDWDQSTIPAIQLESLYAHLDSGLIAEALSEWNVESHRMRDWGYPFWRDDHLDWWDGECRKVDCKLCGHKNNRYEFPILNEKNGKEIWTGSTCIVKYGVTVDGDACSENALKLLNKMKGKSKAAQTRHEWREAHPSADEAMDVVRKMARLAGRKYLDRRVRSHLPNEYNKRRKGFAIWAKAAVKFYDKKEYLTTQRTEQLFEADFDGDTSECRPGQMWRTAIWLQKEWDRAYESSGLKGVHVHWDKFIADHPNMSDSERYRICQFKSYGYTEDDLYGYNREMLRRIEEAHRPKAEVKAEEEKASKEASSEAAKCPWV